MCDAGVSKDQEEVSNVYVGIIDSVQPAGTQNGSGAARHTSIPTDERSATEESPNRRPLLLCASATVTAVGKLCLGVGRRARLLSAREWPQSAAGVHGVDEPRRGDRLDVEDLPL